MTSPGFIPNKNIKSSSNNNDAKLVRPNSSGWKSDTDDNHPTIVILFNQDILKNGGHLKLIKAENVKTFDIQASHLVIPAQVISIKFCFFNIRLQYL